MDDQNKINILLKKLEILSKRQEDFSREISTLKFELNSLKNATPEKVLEKEVANVKEVTSNRPVAVKQEEIQAPVSQEQMATPVAKSVTPKIKKAPKPKVDIEKFIGENLINKIGIAITVIGVAIGAKYSIDNDLISPLTRIILGYLTGLGLLGFGIKLKQKYKSYSAVLVSGAIAIMYFITYAAYSFYGLFPQVFAFGLMVVFTAFTVVTAINYNKQVIAHIGLVGAYAVPFLLSEGSGQVAILFSYMAIINIGILVISIKKYWKALYYVSFVFTWLIYYSWYMLDYNQKEHFTLALVFLTAFFVIFYATFLAYKLFKKEQLHKTDAVLLLLNSFIFYGLGFVILDGHEIGRQLLGVFTVANAVIHFIPSAIIFKKKLANKELLYLVSGMVLIFITIAIPVQLDGNWVTLLWVGEAALLFWIGRTKNILIYEKLAYPLMILAIGSIAQDWSMGYNRYYSGGASARITPLLNIHFLSSILFIAAFSFINYIHFNKKHPQPISLQKGIYKIVSYCIPVILLFVVYYAFYIEIENYWKQLYVDSKISLGDNDYQDVYSDYDLKEFKAIWLINYSLLFVSLLSFINIKKIKSVQLGWVNLGLNILFGAMFLISGLYVISDLRESYLEQHLAEYYNRGVFNIYIRYISLAFFGLCLFACYRYVKTKFFKTDLKVLFEIVLSVSLLWICSSELIHWMDMAEATQSYKLGLSILWGIYSLFLIALGIGKKKKHLRIIAMVLFGITLVKLFFYDISHLDTIAKTIVFVSLGILLLIISFLYNKYKQFISEDNGN